MTTDELVRAKQTRVAGSDLTLDDLAAVIDEAIARAVKPLRERIAVLESSGELKYVGVFREGEKYTRGHFVTRVDADASRPTTLLFGRCSNRPRSQMAND